MTLLATSIGPMKMAISVAVLSLLPLTGWGRTTHSSLLKHFIADSVKERIGTLVLVQLKMPTGFRSLPSAVLGRRSEPRKLLAFHHELWDFAGSRCRRRA